MGKALLAATETFLPELQCWPIIPCCNRDLRQLLWHRHRLVQMRTRVMNQLHVVALNEGVRLGVNETMRQAEWVSAVGKKQFHSFSAVG